MDMVENPSSSVTVKGVPQGIEEAKDYVIETVEMEPASGGAKIFWTNETFVGVDLIASYLDKNNVKQEVTIDATQTGVYVVTGFIAETKIDGLCSESSGWWKVCRKKSM